MTDSRISQGQYALHMQKQLVQHCLAPWPRRGRTLLEVNCGRGEHVAPAVGIRL